MKTYRITATDKDSGQAIASADGNLALVAYVARGLKDEMVDGHTYTASIVATDAIGGSLVEVVTDTAGDADTIAYVLGKKVRKLRAEENAQA